MKTPPKMNGASTEDGFSGDGQAARMTISQNFCSAASTALYKSQTSARASREKRWSPALAYRRNCVSR
jgi:hypothetical protein